MTVDRMQKKYEFKIDKFLALFLCIWEVKGVDRHEREKGVKHIAQGK